MKISGGQFKAQCLKLMDEVKTCHEEVVITKRGKPVARLVPYEETPVPIDGFNEKHGHDHRGCRLPDRREVGCRILRGPCFSTRTYGYGS